MPIHNESLKDNSSRISLEALESLDAGLKQLRELKGYFHLSSDNPDSAKAATPFWFSAANDYNRKGAIVDVEETIRQYQSTARRYKMALKALSSMKNSLKRHLAEMTFVMKPIVLVHGISTIPDEILARIFECIYEPWPSDDTYLNPRPEHLRLVCKRFQHVVDSQPSLRRLFTCTMPIEKLRERLDGCGQVGLRVKISDQRIGWYLHSAISAFADVLIPHAHRWEELHFFHFNYMQEAKQACDKFKSLNLPRLERLVLWSREWDATDKLYSTWTMPNLRKIEFHDGVPLKLPGTGLLECDIHVVLRKQGIRRLTPEIPDFLGSLTSLTTLRVTYSGATFLHIRDMTSPICLPNLRTLVMHMDLYDKYFQSGLAILNLIKHLAAPRLEELSVNYRYEPDRELGVWDLTEDLLCMHDITSSLQIFTLTQECGRTNHDIKSFVENPCNGNMVISGLTLCFYGGHTKFPSHQGGTYGLRTLTFKNCELTKAELKLLLKLYTTREWYPNFEGIMLERCDGVTCGDLAGVAHSEYVFFKDD